MPQLKTAAASAVDDSTINSGRAYARSKPLTETYGCTKLVDATYEGSTVQFCDLAVGTGLEGESGGGVKVTTVARGIENERTYDSKKGYTYPIDSEDGDINLRAAKGLDVAILGCEGMPPMKEGGRRVVRVPAEVAHGGNGIACLLGRKEKCLVPPDSGIEVYVEMISVAY
ncbi:unnamed protein product [Pedinophyceae sp. YPF-701]|nr:unnamed protein product [Pedinophyceae sp. YPF-701]